MHNSTSFWWATGIEDTFIPQTRPGLRGLDEYELTHHYQLWKSDFDLAAETGARFLRWGIPWYRIQPSPNTWDWRWTDEALDYLVNSKGITPIVDLMHYGTPLWLENSFVNSSYPERVAEYAGRVAERYRTLARVYTPLNEPMVNVNLCGMKGIWPPYLCGEDGAVKMLLALARGIVQTVKALEIAQPELVTVQVEALWHHWTQDLSPEVQQRVEQSNARQYLCFDLVTGRVDEEYSLLAGLRTHGVTDAHLDWFREKRVSFDIFGANFYPWSYGQVFVRKDGSFYRSRRRVSGEAIADVIYEANNRYGLPIMVTETSAKRDVIGRARWMDETVAAVCRLRGDGIPVVGYTWFPLFTMVDWKYRTGRLPLQNYLLNLGLYEADFDEQGVLQRKPTVLATRYHNYTLRPMPPIQRVA